MLTASGLSAVLVAALPLGAVGLIAGRFGVAGTVVLPALAALPCLVFAAWFMVTNDSADVADRFNTPGLSGLLVGAILAVLTAPIWGLAFFVGRCTRKRAEA